MDTTLTERQIAILRDIYNAGGDYNWTDMRFIEPKIGIREMRKLVKLKLLINGDGYDVELTMQGLKIINQPATLPYPAPLSPDWVAWFDAKQQAQR